MKHVKKSSSAVECTNIQEKKISAHIIVNYSWHIFVSEFGKLMEQKSLTVRFYFRIALKKFCVVV